ERATPDDAVKVKAAELTRSANTEEERARRVYNFVAQNIRYVSLSFGIGRYQPHTASEVLQNGYGDCKDKHTLLQALLAAEEIKSYPVLIHHDRKLDEDVPSPAQFDHVITAAKVGDKLTWLDSTAEVAPYGLIMYGLRNKQAVLASLDSNSGLRRTTAEAPVRNSTTFNLNGRITELGGLDGNIDISATGDSDFRLRATFRQVAQADWPRALEIVSRVWGIPGDVSDVHIERLEDTTKPLHLHYHIHKADYFKVPNSATIFQVLPPSSVGRVRRVKKNHPGDPLDVGPAGENVSRVHIDFPQNFNIHIPADVSIARDFGEYSTTYKVVKNVLDAQRRMVLKVNELPSSRRADYSSFHNVTTGSVEETPWCSITRPSATALALSAEMKGTPAELREAGEAAFKRQDFPTAAALLQRAADQDPSSKEGWDELGQAYASLRQHEKAVEA